jgi:hypothetical protein
VIEVSVVEKVVEMHIEDFRKKYFSKLLAQKDKPDGLINRKINNIFVTSMGKEISFYSALVRSLESSLGNLVERIGIDLSKKTYSFFGNVNGQISESQINAISSLLNKYHNHNKKPEIADLNLIDDAFDQKGNYDHQYTSDFYLTDKETGINYLIELKAGGDLDNKKSESEKRAILEQYCILKNNLGKDAQIKIYFATAYNMFGEGNYWKQERVRAFFCQEELLIGQDFWNFLLKSENGYEVVKNAFRKYAAAIENDLKELRKIYGIE